MINEKNSELEDDMAENFEDDIRFSGQNEIENIALRKNLLRICQKEKQDKLSYTIRIRWVFCS